jgi:hypothetical protein
MNVLKVPFIAAVVLLAGAAQAQAIRIAVPDEVALPASKLSRAEVIADYHIWRLAGLEALHRGDPSPNTESLQYRQALAKYQWLRASPQFTQMVAELSRRPHAQVLGSKQASGAITVSDADRVRAQ